MSQRTRPTIDKDTVNPRPPATKISPAISGVPTIGEAVDTLAELYAEGARLNSEQDELESALKENGIAQVAVQEATSRARCGLIRAVISASNQPAPPIEDWYYRLDPLWTVWRDDRIFAVVRGNNGTVAEENLLDESFRIDDYLNLVIIDLNNGGAPHAP